MRRARRRQRARRGRAARRPARDRRRRGRLARPPPQRARRSLARHAPRTPPAPPDGARAGSGRRQPSPRLRIATAIHHRLRRLAAARHGRADACGLFVERARVCAAATSAACARSSASRSSLVPYELRPLPRAPPALRRRALWLCSARCSRDHCRSHRSASTSARSDAAPLLRLGGRRRRLARPGCSTTRCSSATAACTSRRPAPGRWSPTPLPCTRSSWRAPATQVAYQETPLGVRLRARAAALTTCTAVWPSCASRAALLAEGGGAQLPAPPSSPPPPPRARRRPRRCRARCGCRGAAALPHAALLAQAGSTAAAAIRLTVRRARPPLRACSMRGRQRGRRRRRRRRRHSRRRCRLERRCALRAPARLWLALRAATRARPRAERRRVGVRATGRGEAGRAAAAAAARPRVGVSHPRRRRRVTRLRRRFGVRCGDYALQTGAHMAPLRAMVAALAGLPPRPSACRWTAPSVDRLARLRRMRQRCSRTAAARRRSPRCSCRRCRERRPAMAGAPP